MLKYFRCSASKGVQRFVYNGRNLSPVWSRTNAARYLWWSTHKPTTVYPAYHPMKEHPTTLTVIVTFVFKTLFWLLPVLCSHGCKLASRKRSSLESCPPSESSSRHIPDRMPGSRNDWSEPPLWWSMPHFFPFGTLSGDLGLENSFFLGRQG